MMARANEHFCNLITIGERFGDLEDELANIARECSSPDWDRYGAKPIKTSAIDDVAECLRNLPAEIKLPNAVPEPTGDLGLEWTSGDKTFVVSFTGQSSMDFAGILGREAEIYGTGRFEGSLPNTIASILVQHFSMRSL